MSSIDKVNLTNYEQQIAKATLNYNHHVDELSSNILDTNKVNELVSRTEALLDSIGVEERPVAQEIGEEAAKTVVARSWKEIIKESEANIKDEVSITDLLSETEISEVTSKIKGLYEEFNFQHKLDGLDYAIAGVAGTLAALVDIFLVKIPSSKGLLGASDTKGGSLSDFFRNHLREKFSPEEIKELEKNNWVPYDAPTSRNLETEVPGLGPRSHRFQSLGHDPILGFIFGVADIMRSTMTAIGTDGKLRIIDIPPDVRTAGFDLFQAIERQIGHLLSDIGTPAGLPAPFMPLLNLLQVGSLGDRGRTIGEMSRLMYLKGYDFGHFLAMSVPVMIIEVLVRTLYFVKRVSEGYSKEEALPFDLFGSKRKPKLQTKLFIAHTVSTAANAGKLYFSQNPLSINYPQWIMFAKYSFSQLQWVAWKKEKERLNYAQDKLDTEWGELNRLLLDEWLITDVDGVRLG